MPKINKKPTDKKVISVKAKEETSLSTTEMRETVELSMLQLTEDAELSTVKGIVCKFYKGGNHPDCFGCTQPESKVEDCKDSYITLMRGNPALVYSPMLETAILRDKVTLFTKENEGAIGIRCDTCYISDKCPMYKPVHACAIDWGDNLPETPDDYMKLLIDTQMKRLRRAILQEELDGGVADQAVSNEMDRLKDLLLNKSDMDRETFSLRVDASRKGPSNSQGGILEKIFGSSLKQLPENE